MQMFDQAWQGIIRPMKISSKVHALGPTHRMVDNMNVVRQDINFKNRNNKLLSGFIFTSPDMQAKETLIYLHGNGGSKLQALPLVNLMVQFEMSVAAFDFAGCGNSEAQNLTYGYNEVHDIREMIEELKKVIPVNKVKLWGRSMGALCAIMYADMYPYLVTGLVLDSPFRNLAAVIDRIAANRVSFPSFILTPFLYFVKQKVVSEITVDIFQYDYLKIFQKVTPQMPVLFVFSNFDYIVPANEVLAFYNAYKGPKDLYEIYRTHDEDRPQDLFKQGLMWITCRRRNHSESAKIAREMMIREQNQIKNSGC